METKHPFIYFTPTIEQDCDCSQALLPVCFGSDIRIHKTDEMPFVAQIGFSAINGDIINQHVFVATSSTIDLSQRDDLSEFLAVNECFRIIILNQVTSEILFYSNPLIYIGCNVDETALFEYWVDGSASQKTRLRAILKEPNPQNEKDEYSDAIGNVFTVAKQRRKQFELEIGFYPEHIHDSIQEMLLFPNLLADDIPMYESGEYVIDWENKEQNDFAKATTQLSEQEIMRFTNC